MDQLLVNLTTAQRSIFEKRLEGLSFEEISAAEGIPLTACKARFQRGLKKLKKYSIE
ncbi:MAG: hypothetical protein JSS75_07570 [Bacteroidetes bacterium]|nr:hypothetical protein [Bacteroidota bacterium]